jgi:hypothetical protein
MALTTCECRSTVVRYQPALITQLRGGRFVLRSHRDARDRRCLVRHQDPQDRVDEELTPRHDQEDQYEQQPCGPRGEAEAAAQPGAHAGQYPTLLRPDKACLVEPLTDRSSLRSAVSLSVVNRTGLILRSASPETIRDAPWSDSETLGPGESGLAQVRAGPRTLRSLREARLKPPGPSPIRRAQLRLGRVSSEISARVVR